MLFNFILPNRCYPNRILSSSSGYYEPLFNNHQYNSSASIFHLTNIFSLRTTARWFIAIFFRLIIIISGIISGFALYHRTTNLWTLKNLGDTFMSKNIGRRPIILGAFHRLKEEQNVDGDFASEIFRVLVAITKLEGKAAIGREESRKEAQRALDAAEKLELIAPTDRQLYEQMEKNRNLSNVKEENEEEEENKD